MSSLWKQQRSKFWTACFTVYVGDQPRQFKKTTATNDKELAKVVAAELEKAGEGKRSSDQVKTFIKGIEDFRAQRAARRAFDDVLRMTMGAGLESRSTRTFVEGWLERTHGEVAASTWVRYKSVANGFLVALGSKADHDIATIQQQDIARFRDEEAKRVKPVTANVSLKVVRIMFGAAESARLVTHNEATHVQSLKIRDKGGERRAFTVGELKRILEACDDEWRSMVLFGFYTGARLGDIAMLTWENVDLAHKELRYESAKTGRRILVPLAQALQELLKGRSVADKPKEPLHPRAYDIVGRQNRVATLSNGFYEILVSAGLVKERSHKAQDKKANSGGRDKQRNQSELSFHALRHSAVTMLKLAGVGETVAMDLVGHDSAEISRHYTHVDHATKLDAVNRLPVLSERKEQVPPSW